MKFTPVALTAAAVAAAALMSGCVVAPLGVRPVVVRPAYVQQEFAQPPSVIYVQPTYAVPAVGYAWGYHPYHGWGYRLFTARLAPRLALKWSSARHREQQRSAIAQAV